MEMLTQIVSNASDFLWNVILIILLCGTGFYYTIRLRFIQVRKFREGLGQVSTILSSVILSVSGTILIRSRLSTPLNRGSVSCAARKSLSSSALAFCSRRRTASRAVRIAGGMVYFDTRVSGIFSAELPFQASLTFACTILPLNGPIAYS